MNENTAFRPNDQIVIIKAGCRMGCIVLDEIALEPRGQAMFDSSSYCGRDSSPKLVILTYLHRQVRKEERISFTGKRTGMMSFHRLSI